MLEVVHIQGSLRTPLCLSITYAILLCCVTFSNHSIQQGARKAAAADVSFLFSPKGFPGKSVPFKKGMGDTEVMLCWKQKILRTQ